MTLDTSTSKLTQTYEKPNIYVLFHHPCSDGMGAKYAAWKKFGDSANYIGVNYGQPLPEIPRGSDLYIIDFSYPKDVLRNLNGRMNKLLVLDHHKTAQEDLAGEPYAVFDMDRSGAVLAWNYFHPGVPVPTLLQMIQDRDLWQWKIPHSKPVLEFLRVHGDDVKTWDTIIEPGEHVIEVGKYLNRYKDSLVAQAVKPEEIKFTTINGYKVAIRNGHYFPSEIGSELCKKYSVDFSITYFITNEGVVSLSFRSIGNKDVSKIAKVLGGGGHKNAAGARIGLAGLGELLFKSDFHLGVEVDINS